MSSFEQTDGLESPMLHTKLHGNGPLVLGKKSLQYMSVVAIFVHVTHMPRTNHFIPPTCGGSTQNGSAKMF